MDASITPAIPVTQGSYGYSYSLGTDPRFKIISGGTKAANVNYSRTMPVTIRNGDGTTYLYTVGIAGAG